MVGRELVDERVGREEFIIKVIFNIYTSDFPLQFIYCETHFTRVNFGFGKILPLSWRIQDKKKNNVFCVVAKFIYSSNEHQIFQKISTVLYKKHTVPTNVEVELFLKAPLKNS